MTFFGWSDLFLVCGLRIRQLLIPMLIELLVLANVCLFALLTLRFMHEAELFLSARVLLVLEFGDTVVSHFGFNVASLTLHLLAMLFKGLSSITIIKLVKI